MVVNNESNLHAAALKRGGLMTTSSSVHPGSVASAKEFFGGNRLAIYAVNTRFETVDWFVADAWTIDPVTGYAGIVGQYATRDEALQRVRELTGSARLDTKTVQLWRDGSMLTAQMPVEVARQLVDGGDAWVISSQAIGQASPDDGFLEMIRPSMRRAKRRAAGSHA